MFCKSKLRVRVRGGGIGVGVKMGKGREGEVWSLFLSLGGNEDGDG